MDSTVNRGYPYPECDPPLTKDASDIAHVYNLAAAIDTDVQTVYDRAGNVIIRPDAGRMTMSGNTAGSESLAVPLYDVRSFDTTPSGTAMTDIFAKVMRFPEPGWYLVGADIQFTAASHLGARLAFMTQSGAQATPFSVQANAGIGGFQRVQQSAEVHSPGQSDQLFIIIRIANPMAYTFSSRIWAQRMAQG